MSTTHLLPATKIEIDIKTATVNELGDEIARLESIWLRSPDPAEAWQAAVLLDRVLTRQLIRERQQERRRS